MEHENLEKQYFHYFFLLNPPAQPHPPPATLHSTHRFAYLLEVNNNGDVVYKFKHRLPWGLEELEGHLGRQMEGKREICTACVSPLLTPRS